MIDEPKSRGGQEILSVHLYNKDEPPTRTLIEKVAARATPISVVVALLVATLGLVFTVWPNWKPLGPPTKIGGSVAKVGVTSNVTFEEYWRSIGRTKAPKPPSGSSPADNQVGYEVLARVDLAGDETHVYTAIPAILDAETLREVADKPPVQPDVQQPDVRDYSAGFRTWIGVELPPGQYLFRISLYDGGTPPPPGQTKPGPGDLVDFALSEPYTVSE